MEQVTERVLDGTRLNALLGKMLNDIGAALMGSLIILGDKLMLYKTLADFGPLSSTELAAASDTSERYVREWLSAQAASGYIEYDKDTNKFYMLPEQAAVFADDQSPVLMTGGYYSVSSMYHDEPKVREAFKTGKGIIWDDHHNCLFCGVERFYGPSYRGFLINSWIPALNGVEEKLRTGALVADVGCGHGVATILMAKAFPNSEFVGYDIHELSIKHARSEAEKLGLTNISFEVASAKSYPQKNYDLITFFDALHDMGDAEGVAAYAVSSLGKEGTSLIVEPFAHDELQKNFTPVGRAFYASSTMVCTPTALSQNTGNALGAQAGRTKLTKVLTSSGFSKVRVAVETPFNLIFEAKR